MEAEALTEAEAVTEAGRRMLSATMPRSPLALSPVAVLTMFFAVAEGLRCYVGEKDSHKLQDCGLGVEDCAVTIRHSIEGEMRL